MNVTSRPLEALALGVLLAATQAGCILRDFHYPIVTERFGTAVCTCAVCWNRPFCHSELAPDEFPEPVDGVCPGGFMLSVPASRVTTYDTREPFFCADIAGAVLDHPSLGEPSGGRAPLGGFCPTPGTTNRARLAAMDPCTDVIFECRNPTDAEFASCPVLPPDASSCPSRYQRGVEVSGCSNADDGGRHVVEKLVIACAHGRPSAVPIGSQPERYCYAACLDDFRAEWDGPSGTCLETLFDPPEVTAGSYAWLLAGTSSTVTVTVGSETATFAVEGRVAFHSPRCLPGQTCRAELPFLRAVVPHAFTLDGRTFSGVVFQNPVPIRGGRVLPFTFDESKIEFGPGAEIFATADVSGASERRGALVTSNDNIRGSIRWDARIVTIDATFSEPSTSTTVALHIVGSIPNRTPIANAGSDVTLECTSPEGTLVSLSGAGSFDPDDPQGTQSILYYNWTDVSANATSPLAVGGRDVTIRQHPGQRDYDLTVRDESGSATTDSVHVTVEDTIPPSFDPSVLPLCIPADNRMRLFTASDYAAAFADACDHTPAFAVAGIESSQIDTGVFTPDARRSVGGSFCVRGEREPLTTTSRTYTITIEASDSAGNARLVSFPVVVPVGACPGATWAVPAVADTDPACGAPTSPDAGPGADAGVSPPPPVCNCRVAGTSGAILPIVALVGVLAMAVRRARRSRARKARAVWRA